MPSSALEGPPYLSLHQFNSCIHVFLAIFQHIYNGIHCCVCRSTKMDWRNIATQGVWNQGTNILKRKEKYKVSTDSIVILLIRCMHVILSQCISLKHTRHLHNFVSIKLSYLEVDYIALRNTYKVEPKLLPTNYSYQTKQMTPCCSSQAKENFRMSCCRQICSNYKPQMQEHPV